MIETTPETDTAAAVLAAARADRAVADAAEARLLQHAVNWAAMHSVESHPGGGDPRRGCVWRGGDAGRG